MPFTRKYLSECDKIEVFGEREIIQWLTVDVKIECSIFCFFKQTTDFAYHFISFWMCGDYLFADS